MVDSEPLSRPPVAGEEEPVAPAHVWVEDRVLKVSVVLLALIGTAAALYFAAGFLMPVTLSFLFALVLSPVVRALRRRRVPEGLTAAGIVLGLSLALASALYFLSGPVTQWVGKAPEVVNDIRMHFDGMSGTVDAVQDASETVEEMTDDPDPDVQKVVVREPGLLTKAAFGAPNLVARIVLTLVLLFFLLASGDMFYEKLVAMMPTFSDKKRAVRIARDVEREVSRYLLTITVINSALGVCVWAAMFTLGVPNPVLWGIVAAVLNFIPYIGAIIGILLVALVSFATFDTLEAGILPPLAYLALTTLEGQLLTPTIVGRRLELNAVAIFIAVAFWAWIWGIAGALVAVPFLVIVKILSDHVEGMHALGQFLSARHLSPLHEEDLPPPAGVAEQRQPGE